MTHGMHGMHDNAISHSQNPLSPKIACHRTPHTILTNLPFLHTSHRIAKQATSSVGHTRPLALSCPHFIHNKLSVLTPLVSVANAALLQSSAGGNFSEIWTLLDHAAAIEVLNGT